MLPRLLPYSAKGPLAGLICSLSASSALANGLLSWEQLNVSCRSADPQKQAQCQGYIMGAADAAALCIPAGIKPSTLQDLAISTIVVTDASQPAALALQRRLESIFPCPGGAETPPAATHAEDGPASSQRSENWSNKKRIGK